MLYTIGLIIIVWAINIKWCMIVVVIIAKDDGVKHSSCCR